VRLEPKQIGTTLRDSTIALDEDDIIAILTRQLVEEYHLFYSTISLSQQKNIPPSDQSHFTTIVTLYDTLDIYFRSYNSKYWKNFKRKRPSDEEIAVFFKNSTDLWDTLTEYFIPLQELKQIEVKGEVVARYRHELGGHLLFRPIGLLIIFRVIRALIDSQVPLTQGVSLISNVPMELAKSPWADLLWDTVNKRMMTAPENQKVAVQMLFYGVGGDISKLSRGLRTENINNVRTELAGLLKKNITDVEIRRYV
jgi:DNA sulfur modification protein DndB